MYNRNMNCRDEIMVCKDEIAIILEKVDELQKRAVHEELKEKFCDADFLGEIECKEECNTRPIQVFTSEDKAWYCPIDRNEDGCVQSEGNNTCVFRVEKVKNGAVVLRALKEEYVPGGKVITATNSFITIKIDKIAAIRCFKDCFVNICIV